MTNVFLKLNQALVELTPTIISPKFVTVRTKSSDKLSNESSAAPVPLSNKEEVRKMSEYSGGARPRDPPGKTF